MIHDTLLVIAIIIFTTFVQKYYFWVLHRIKAIHPFFGLIFWFIIRFWVIIHEICHMIFGFLSGNKIEEIRLFDPTGGRVIFKTKNYIGGISEYGRSGGYLFALIFNQIWLFLISFWPLFFGILCSYLVLNSFWVTDLESLIHLPITYHFFFFILLYSIFIPSFVLSFQDIRNFVISDQDDLLATIVGSLVNTFIFLCVMLSISSFLVSYFVFFLLLFLGLFLVQLILFAILSLINRFG